MAAEHTHTVPLYANVVVTKKPGSLVVVTGEIPLETVAAYRDKAIRHLGRDIELPGFRKGHVPPHMLVSSLGEMRILEETAELVLGHGYGHLVEEHGLRVLGRPSITLTKLVPDAPIAFSIETALYPELTFPDHKAVAGPIVKEYGAIDALTLSDQELEAEITRIRELMRTKEERAATDAPLPELTDAVVAQLGPFKSLEDFTAQLKERLLEEKKRSTYQKRRIAIADALVAKTQGDIPEVVIEHELDRMKKEFEANLGRMNLEWNGYLEHIKKSEEDLRSSWREDARKRAMLEFALAEIAKRENITPEAEELDNEVRRITEEHPATDPDAVRAYVTTILTNDAVFAFLEKV